MPTCVLTQVLVMVAAYVGTWIQQERLHARKRPLALLIRGAAAALAFLGIGFTLGLIFFLGTDYPCFLWIEDSATHCGFGDRESDYLAGVLEIPSR